MTSNGRVLELELRVFETSPLTIEMHVTAPLQQKDGDEGPPTRIFKVAYILGTSILGVLSGSDSQPPPLTFSPDNLQGIVSLIDGGYDDETQQSPERTVELHILDVNFATTVGKWVLPRQKHERHIRIDMITGALKALLQSSD